MAEFGKEDLSNSTFDWTDLSGSTFRAASLSNVTIRGTDLHHVKMTGVELWDVDISGEVRGLRINGVDVTAYVEEEMARREPDLAKMQPDDPDGFREAWDLLEGLWDGTVERARRLDPAQLHEQVDGEWSFVETQRHLLMASDAWIGNAVLEEDAPYHPLGLPSGGMPAEASAKLGLTLDATPTLDEVLAPRLARMATMRRVVDELTEAELDRVCGRKPADPYPDREYVVRRCLTVVCKEEAEHHRYAVRDLTVLEADARTE
jgi:DinB superfamily/Pentapeptide repeats (8 copies)